MNIPEEYQLLASASIHLHGDMNEVETQLEQIYNAMQIKYPKFYKMNLLCKLGFLTAEQLFNSHPSLQHTEVPAAQCGTILFNASSSVSSDIIHATAIDDPVSIPGPGVFVYTLPNILNGELSIRHGWTGYNGFFIVSNEPHKDDVMAEILAMSLNSQDIGLCLTGWIETDILNGSYSSNLSFIAKK